MADNGIPDKFWKWMADNVEMIANTIDNRNEN